MNQATERMLKAKADIGKSLDRLSKNEDFKLFMSEMEDRIATYRERSMDVLIDHNELQIEIGKLRGLLGMKIWMEDEIEDGARALHELAESDGPAIPEGPGGSEND